MFQECEIALGPLTKSFLEKQQICQSGLLFQCRLKMGYFQKNNSFSNYVLALLFPRFFCFKETIQQCMYYIQMQGGSNITYISCYNKSILMAKVNHNINFKCWRERRLKHCWQVFFKNLPSLVLTKPTGNKKVTVPESDFRWSNTTFRYAANWIWSKFKI